VSVLFISACLHAGANSDTWKKYNNIMDDGDSYVGEGVSQASEFNGDAMKAADTARQRARASLAESIRVHIASETTESVQGGAKGVTETIESRSKESADLAIENVHLREFPDFPDPGKTTVLAYVSKEDYLRQMAHQGVPVYRPQWGVSVGYDLYPNSLMTKLVQASDKYASPALAATNQGPGGLGEIYPGTPGPLSGYDVAFTSPYGLLDVAYYQQNLDVWQDAFCDSCDSNGNGINNYSTYPFSMTLLLVQAGYDWTPWLWRLQPFVPLRAGIGFLGLDNTGLAGEYNYSATLYEVSGGLGLRWWLNGEFSLEFSANENVALGSEALKSKQQGGTQSFYFLRTATAPNVDLGEYNLHWGVKWSGF
jgi:hypothetical protein